MSRRKCRCCNQFFLPDPRANDRQRYCSEPACRHASKAASQRRWLSQNGNGDYFRGPQAVRRVQLWSHPVPAAILITLLGIFWVGRKIIGLV